MEQEILLVPHEPIGVLGRICSSATEAMGEKQPYSLVVGTHSVEPVVGDSLLSHCTYPDAHRDLVYGTPQDVLAALRLRMHRHYQHYTIAISGFEAHHFEGRDLQDFIDVMRVLCHGVVVFADYTFRGHSSDEVVPYTRSKSECVQQQLCGGYDKWLREHAVFTPDSFMQSVSSVEWNSMRGLQFKFCKVGAVGSSSLSQNDLDEIVRLSIEP